jgi:uncharacterized protein
MLPLQKSTRIEVIDALRGFAILSIMLLHNIEHFDLYHFPDYLPTLVKSIDSVIWNSLFFIFGGKSYAIFALLFGLTFYIQFNNRQKTGQDFSGRFLWRLFILLIFGIINSVFFEGDILAFYAIIGVVLIPFRKFRTSVLFGIAITFMIQPLEWGKFFYILSTPDYVDPVKLSDQYFARIGEYLGNGSFWDVAKGNLTNGRTAVVYWSLENGRFFQTASLFLFGMLLGRQYLFETSEKNTSFWKRALIISAITFVPLFFLKRAIPEIIDRAVLHGPLNLIINTWANFAFMTVLVAAFVLLYQKRTFQIFFTKLQPLGRMSLSNYVMQSIVGSLVYYGFGLGLYLYTGASLSLIIGIVLAVLQTVFSKWWLSKYNHGPLEFLWHKATWIKL